MINVQDKRSIYNGCGIISTFNLPTEKRGLYCGEQRLDNMINIKHKQCYHDGCNKRPRFKLPSEPRGLFCAEHKLENMINVKINNVFIIIVVKTQVLTYQLKHVVCIVWNINLKI